MSVINFRRKEIIAKIVYYGPGLSGKTTNVQQIHASMPPETRGELTSLATEQDRTLFFDYVPIHLGNIGGFKTKFQIFTVPGQVYYSATRRVVLQATDGVVFVADSSPDSRERNLESLADLKQNLLHHDKFLNALPFVIQYNKRDLEDALPIEDLERDLNEYGAPSFPAVAFQSQGVLETLSKISSLVLTHLKASIEGKLTQGKKDATVIQKFDEEEPDDAELVRSLLAQISEVRKHEAAEVSIVEEDDEEALPAATVVRPTGALPSIPTMSAVGASGGTDTFATAAATGPRGTPSRMTETTGPIPAGAVPASSPPPGIPPSQTLDHRGGLNGHPPPPTGDLPIPVRATVHLPGRSPAASVVSGSIHEVDAGSPTPAAGTPTGQTRITGSQAQRGPAELPGFGPGDAPPWDNRQGAQGRPIPVPTGTLEVVEVGTPMQRGNEVRVPIVVRDGGGEPRPLTLDLKLGAVPTGAPPALPSWLFAWLGGLTFLVLLALLMAAFG